MGTVILVLVLVMLGLIILVLLAPFHVFVEGEYANAFSGALSVSWLWRLVRFESYFAENRFVLHFLGISFSWKAAKVPSKKAVKRKEMEQKSGPGIRGLLRLAANTPEMIRIVKKIFGSLVPQGNLQGTVGLEDPAATGVFIGIYHALKGLFAFPFLIDPDFREKQFSLSGCLKIRILNISLLAIVLSELFSSKGRAFLRSLKQMRD